MKNVFLVSLLFLFSSACFAKADADSWNYQDVKGYKACVKCHENQVEVWEKTRHYKTYKEITKHKNAKDIALKMGVKPKRIKKSTLCASCHFTLGSKKGRPKTISGVSCESCHGPAKKWIDVHNEFGGKGVKRKFESPEHRAKRHAKQTSLGMNFPGAIYGFAKNCYGCHMVGNEKLVNVTKHGMAKDFDFVKRTQGDLRHGPKAGKNQLRKMRVIGYAVELELGLNALSTAGNGRFADNLKHRIASAIANLEKIQQTAPDSSINIILTQAKSNAIEPGNQALKQSAKQIGEISRKFSDTANVSSLAGVENHNHIKLAKSDIDKYLSSSVTKVSSPQESHSDPKPKPVTKPKPKTNVQVAKITPPKVERIKKPINNPAPVVASTKTKVETNQTIATASPLISQPTGIKKGLIGQFNVYVALGNKLCESNNPWVLGKTKLRSGGSMTSKDCFSLELKLNQSGNVYFFSQSSDGKTFRMFPNACNALGNLTTRVSQGRSIELPVNNENKVMAIGLDNKKGNEWLYAVAVNSSAAEKSFNRLVLDIPDVCDTSVNAKLDNYYMQNVFSNLKKQHGKDFDWKSIKFQHK